MFVINTRQRFGAAFLACVSMCVALCPTARAELLDSTELADCRLHVVGMYSPENGNEDDRIFVEVERTGQPMIIVLTGYYGAQWNVTIDSAADVRQIIVAGYYQHSIVVDQSIPVEMVTYFQKDENSRDDYFWAYAWHTEYGRKLRERLKEMTGLEITTFQGQYSARRFTIDGKKGLVDPTNTTGSKPWTESIKSSSQSPDEKLRKTGVAAKSHRRELAEKFGPDHPMVQQMDRALATIEAELKRLGAKPLADIDRPAEDRTSSKSARETIESLVRESFALETQLQLTRIAKAESDLARIKQNFDRRLDAGEEIIAKRVATLIQKKTVQPSDSEASASLLATEGWKAWRDRDLTTALAKFQSAVKKDPDDLIALNGLGWTNVNLGYFEKAIPVFEKIIHAQPKHLAALNGVGQSLLGLGRLDEAESKLIRATETGIQVMGEDRLVQQNATASWFGLINVYLRQEYPEKAIEWAERYLKHKPDDTQMQSMLEQARAMAEKKGSAAKP